MSSSGLDSVDRWCVYLRGCALLSDPWAGERVEDGGGVGPIRWNITCARRSRALAAALSGPFHHVLSEGEAGSRSRCLTGPESTGSQALSRSSALPGP